MSLNNLLTVRELQVMKKMQTGKTSREAGESLGISEMTVKNHLRRIYQKLGVRNRAEAVSKAMSLNIL